MVLLLGRYPPPPSSSLLSGSEQVRGIEVGLLPAEDASPWAARAGGLGGRGGGGAAGAEAWSSAGVRESTLGVEDGRRGGGGCGVEAGRGIWYPLGAREG